MRGKVVQVHPQHKFGFIKPDGETDDIYYHGTAMAEGHEFEDVRPGDDVVFDVVETKKGPRAVKVGKVD